MVATVTSPELAALVSTTDVDLVDVRDEREWLSGHVPGSRNVPLDTLRADPDAYLARNKPIVFICQRGVRSLTAAKLAERLGFETLYNLDGGTAAWSKSGHSLSLESVSAAA
ncbi:MAG: rhodanese-like domain-containing protein [Deltaproteobacteria bacterium]|nr:rhodanese-like domain-containing protein [Deltaproteobacteria bacterium]